MECSSLTADDVTWATQLAEGTYGRYRGVQGEYGNTAAKHDVGKLGEIGAARWLEAQGCQVDHAFADGSRDREADVVADGHRVEVKTWSTAYWDEMGRCATPHQLRSIAKKADLIVWMTVRIVRGEVEACVMGWSTPDDVARTPIVMTGPQGQLVANHQVAISDLRAIDALRTRLAR